MNHPPPIEIVTDVVIFCNLVTKICIREAEIIYLTIYKCKRNMKTNKVRMKVVNQH